MKVLNRYFNRKKTPKSDSSKPKEGKEILEEQIDMSMKEFNRSNLGLFMSAFTAGLEIGFSVLFMGTIFTMFGEQLSPEVMKLLMALCYPIGFIFVIIGRSELFTEHTSLAILPALNGSVRFRNILVLWALVYSGNLIGGYIFSLLISKIGPVVGFIKPSTFHHLAEELVDYNWDTILLSALLAGWMMGLLGWLVTSSQDTISRILVISLVTFIIGVAGLHHCIVGSIEVFTGVLSSSEITFDDYLKFQFWATVGNAVGGSVFVAILKFSHVRFK
ncbi:formate/nitrite transporter family protein [Reichenbachiella ulvae]|uniref:Formate/nitrite transporter family protein n=1 Tax=Reichenbachiella ulvae TaxID=2980104 RepID=A0ABT3CPD9_9BACT|nr:formate/nitrite transporter family protein [Reichenbachiella ulvae]MCV9385441.1 formate/nitrite transporter family protein [Reichenbachiella ulvae]